MDFPRTVLEFERRFATEADCIEYLRQQRWPEGFRCPRCGGARARQLRTRPLDQCASCDHQTAWTWLHKIRSLMDRSSGQRLRIAVEADESCRASTGPFHS